jgi:hypothetical protein
LREEWGGGSDIADRNPSGADTVMEETELLVAVERSWSSLGQSICWKAQRPKVCWIKA